jgi:hypothetical protein
VGEDFSCNEVIASVGDIRWVEGFRRQGHRKRGGEVSNNNKGVGWISDIRVRSEYMREV